MDKLYVDLGNNSYNIHFTDSFLQLAEALSGIDAPKKLLVVTDTNVAPLYGDEVMTLLRKSGYDAALHEIPAGEKNKGMSEILRICESCMKHSLDRKSMILALGGGVVGDMSGFAASIYMRGIDFVQIPTTLLSQSDSSVGGKTGVDFNGAKNILGAFHQPRLVYINVSTLRTLPETEFISGMGEVIKHGIIRDYDFYTFIKNNAELIKSLNSDTLIEMAKRNCSIKADVVEQDERENGLRAILNFGHTIGHAVESSLDFTMTHGECVGLGMCAASSIAYERGMISIKTLNDIENTLSSYGFKTRTSLPDTSEIYALMQQDKKKANGKLKFVLPEGIGRVCIVTDVTEAEIRSAIDHIRS